MEYEWEFGRTETVSADVIEALGLEVSPEDMPNMYVHKMYEWEGNIQYGPTAGRDYTKAYNDSDL